MENKPYIVTHKPTGYQRLVECKSKGAARATASQNDYDVRVPSYKELLDLGAKNTPILSAGKNEESGNGEEA